MSASPSNSPHAASASQTPATAPKAIRTRAKNARDPVTDAIRARVRRIFDGISPNKIAVATGYNHETVRRYLIAGILPSDFLYAICVAYGICPKYLILGIGTPFADGGPTTTVQQRVAESSRRARASAGVSTTGGANLKFHGLPPRPESPHSRK